MLQLSLGYVVQADREREVVEDLRNRQVLQSRRESRPIAAIDRPSYSARRSPVRLRGTGA